MNANIKKQYEINYGDPAGYIIIKDNDDNFDFVTMITEGAKISFPKEIIIELNKVLNKFSYEKNN